jgi:hypothetical protein
MTDPVAAPRARPQAWLLALSFLVIGLGALVPVLALRAAAERGWAGLVYQPAASARARLFGRAEPGRIEMLDPKGPAARAGIRPGDRVLAVGGVALSDSAGLDALGARVREGDVVPFLLERDSVQIRRDVRLGGYLDSLDDRILALLYGLLALAYFAIGLLVYVRRPEESRALVFHVLSLVFAVSFLAAIGLTGPVLMRGFDRGFPFRPEFFVSFGLIVLASYVAMALFLHFALVFPRRHALLRDHPALPVLIHGAAPTLLAASLVAAFMAPLERQLPRPASLALLAALAFACVFLARALRRDRMRPLPLLALVVLGWSALSLALRLLRPAIGDAARWIGLAVTFVPLLLSLVVPVACGALTVIALIQSYRESDLEARQQIRWPLFALVTNIVGGGIVLVLSLVLPGVMGVGESVDAQRLFEYVSVASSLLIPVAFAVAILKYRLFDLGLVVRRTAIYGLVTFALAVVYLGLVAGVGGILVAPLGARAGQWPAVLGTLGVAALFVPARNWAQRIVDRSFFRVRYDATTSLGRLGRTLATTADAPARAKAAIEELVSSLRLRGAAVDLRSPDGRSLTRAAALGTAASGAAAGGAPPVPWSAELAQALARGEAIAPDRLPRRRARRCGRRAASWSFPCPARAGRSAGWRRAHASPTSRSTPTTAPTSPPSPTSSPSPSAPSPTRAAAGSSTRRAASRPRSCPRRCRAWPATRSPRTGSRPARWPATTTTCCRWVGAGWRCASPTSPARGCRPRCSCRTCRPR